GGGRLGVRPRRRGGRGERRRPSLLREIRVSGSPGSSSATDEQVDGVIPVRIHPGTETEVTRGNYGQKNHSISWSGPMAVGSVTATHVPLSTGLSILVVPPSAPTRSCKPTR